VGVVPADGRAELDGGTRAVALVARRVRAVVEHAVLHVDEPGEGQVREQLATPVLLLEEGEEHAVRVQHLPTLHQGQPVIQTLLERSIEGHGDGIGPMPLGRGDGIVRISLLAAAAVMSRHLSEQLIPRIEPRRYVPDRLGERKILEARRHVGGQVHARARAEQTVIVVHEAHEAVVDALVVRDVGVRGVDADDLAEDLRPCASGTHEVVEDRAGPHLITREDSLFELAVQASCLVHHGSPSSVMQIVPHDAAAGQPGSDC
jgi:hypothetical protein